MNKVGHHSTLFPVHQSMHFKLGVAPLTLQLTTPELGSVNLLIVLLCVWPDAIHLGHSRGMSGQNVLKCHIILSHHSI